MSTTIRLAFIATALTPIAALAQTAAPQIIVASTNAWSADLTNALTGMAVIVLPVVGGMLVQALRKLAVKWDLEGTAQDTANTESDIKAALNVGITKVLPLIEKNGWNSPTVRAAVVSGATDYLRQRFPDRTAQIVAQARPGLESSTPAIAETLAARLPDAMTAAAASPATPPAPSPKPLDPVVAPVTA